MKITNVELLNAIERLGGRIDNIEREQHTLKNCIVGENMDNGLMKEFTILKSKVNILCGGIVLVGVPVALYLVYQLIEVI